MDDHLHGRTVLPEEIRHAALVADIDIVVPISFELGLETPPVPRSAGLLPEELAAHVVVYTDDIQPLLGEKPRRLRSDQTGRSSNYGNSHFACLFISVWLRALGRVRAAHPKMSSSI